jgi:aspartyl protease family protein
VFFRILVLFVGVGAAIGFIFPLSKPVAKEASLATEKAAVARATNPSLDTVLERRSNGHFYADVMVNDHVLNFIVDTGATTIALTEDDARRLGLNFSPVEYTVIGKGAGGEVRGKLVTLHHVAMGQKEAWDVEAVIIEGGTMSLLGQNFLGQIGSVSISGDKMVLR